jgi:hypothetical protein
MRCCPCCGLEMPHTPEEARLCPLSRIIKRRNRAVKNWLAEVEVWAEEQRVAGERIRRGEKPPRHWRPRPPFPSSMMGNED